MLTVDNVVARCARTARFSEGIGLTVAKREIGGPAFARPPGRHRCLHVDGVEIVEPWVAGACGRNRVAGVQYGLSAH
jgi:hypothetical protein